MDENLRKSVGLSPWEFRRIAITLEQAVQYNLPTERVTGHHNAGQHAIRKRYASRYGLEKVELDAFQPSSLLEQIISEAIEEHIDLEAWESRQEEVAPERTRIQNERTELAERLSG